MHLDQFSCKHFFQHLVGLNVFKAAALIIFLEKKNLNTLESMENPHWIPVWLLCKLILTTVQEEV